jgi:hypothetical protein
VLFDSSIFQITTSQDPLPVLSSICMCEIFASDPMKSSRLMTARVRALVPNFGRRLLNSISSRKQDSIGLLSPTNIWMTNE